MAQTKPDDKQCSCGTPIWIIHCLGDDRWYQCLNCGKCYDIEDACEFCFGHKDGLPSDAIIGHTICDYCTALYFEIRSE